MLFRLLFFTLPSIVVLDTQTQNTKMRFSKLIIENIAQKAMAKFGFGRRLHDFEYFEVGYFLHTHFSL